MKKSVLITIGVLVVILAIVITLILTRVTKEEKPFNIAFNEWVGFAPFFLAKEKGFNDNLDVEFHFIALERDKRAGLYAGRFQMICETIDMFQTNRDAPNYPGKIVFAVDESYGGDGVVAVKEIRSLKDLKDRTVVSEPGVPARFVLQYLLHKEGITLEDVKLQDMASSDAAAAFIAGKADVAGTYEPYLTDALKKREGAHLLVSSRNLPGLIVDVAIAGDAVLKEREKDIRKIFKGWCKAVEYFEKNREEAVAIMAKSFKLKPEEFEDTISGIRYSGYSRNEELFGSGRERGPVSQTFDEIGEILKANNLTRATASAEEKIIASIVATTLK